MLSNDRGKLRSAQTLYIEENKRLADLKCRKKVVHQKEYFEDVLKSSDSLSVDEAVYGNERGDWIKTPEFFYLPFCVSLGASLQFFFLPLKYSEV